LRPAARNIIIALVLFLAIFFIAYFVHISDDPIKIKTSIWPRSVYIGDTVKFTITVVSDKNIEIKLPDIKRKLRKFDIEGVSETEEKSFRRNKIKQTYLLSKYESGRYQIPRMTIKYRREGEIIWSRIKTEGKSVFVKTLIKVDLEAERRIKIGGMYVEKFGYGTESLGGGQDRGRFMDVPIRYYVNDIRPPKDILTLKDIVIKALLVLVSVVLLAALVMTVASFIKSMSEKKMPPAYQVALKRLNRLGTKKLIEKNMVKEFASELYSILTAYTRARFKFGKREMTGAELSSKIDGLKDLSEDQKAFLKQRILLCELIKYSEQVFSKESLGQSLKEELEFVRETAEKEEE